MQPLEPTGTRRLLLIKGITQTGPSVPAQSGGCPLFMRVQEYVHVAALHPPEGYSGTVSSLKTWVTV